MGLSGGSSTRACCLGLRGNGGGIRAPGLPRMKAWTCIVLKMAGGLTKTVDQHTKIPGAFAGHIVKIDRDFLGRSIYMSHAIFTADGRQLLSAFGHTLPRESLKIGDHVAAGEIIATISGFIGPKTALAPHVHLTFAWAPVPLALERLDWKTLAADPGITLIDPLPVISRHITRQGRLV